jgi:hypothetical protein
MTLTNGSMDAIPTVFKTAIPTEANNNINISVFLSGLNKKYILR